MSGELEMDGRVAVGPWADNRLVTMAIFNRNRCGVAAGKLQRDVWCSCGCDLVLRKQVVVLESCSTSN